MAKKDSSTGKKIAIGAAIGVAAGFVTGILTAPKSGKETRKDIKNAASKLTNELEKKLKVLYSELNDVIKDAKKFASVKGAKAKKQLEAALHQATLAQQKVKEALSAVRSGEADNPELQKAVDDASKALKHLKKFFDQK